MSVKTQSAWSTGSRRLTRNTHVHHIQHKGILPVNKIKLIKKRCKKYSSKNIGLNRADEF